MSLMRQVDRQAITLLDPYVVSGRYNEMRTVTLRDYGRDTIDALIRAAESRTSLFSGLSIAPLPRRGDANRVDRQRFRRAGTALVVEILAAWPTFDNDPGAHIAWADRVYTELGIQAIPGGYPNLIGPSQAAQAGAAYGPNGGRLRNVKHRFDPDNVLSSTPPLPAN
jgi:hypothetical protein